MGEEETRVPQPTPWAWAQPSWWRCPRCGVEQLTAELSPRCPRCLLKESAS